ENELIAPAILLALREVRGLARGRSKARETQPVQPVPQEHVEATLPHLLPPVAAMVRLQLLTGMRPGEVVIMRAIDIECSGKIWLYGPESHKTAWRGHQRVVAIGPRGQEIVRQFLKTNVSSYLFSRVMQSQPGANKSEGTARARSSPAKLTGVKRFPAKF